MVELDGRGCRYGRSREKVRLWVLFMVLLVAVAVAPASMAGSCTYALHATKTVFGPEGGSGTMTVDTQEGCTWTAVAWGPAPS